MNPYTKISLLFITNFLAFKIGGLWIGLISLCIVVYKILNIIGYTRNPSIFKGSFQNGISFTKDYVGPYSQHKDAFLEATKLIETYKLKNFVVFAIYYDMPNTVEESKLKCSIGIYQKNFDKVPEEFERYCEQNGYNKNELPNANSLYSSWEYINYSSMMIGINKFYKIMNYNLKDANFKRIFRVDESKIKVFIEVYEQPNSYMSFYIPLLNSEKFLIFKKDK